jgi:hypothetical protein
MYYAVFDCQNLLGNEDLYFESVRYKEDTFLTDSKVIHLDIPIHTTKNYTNFWSNVGVTRYRSVILECDSTLVHNSSMNWGRVIQKLKIGAVVEECEFGLFFRIAEFIDSMFSNFHVVNMFSM